jgi:O-antigen/teichoic acid export membrane protein
MDESGRKLGQMLRNFLGLGAGNYGAMAVSLAINAMVTRRLGVDQFGRLALLLMASQVLSLLAASWTQMGVVRFGALEFASNGSVARTLWTRVWITAPWGAAGALLMLAFRHRLAEYLGIPAWGLALILLHFVATFVLSTVGTAFQAREQMRRYGVVLFLDKIVMATLILLLPLHWVRDPLTVVGMYAVSSLGAALWGLMLLGPRSVLPVTFDRAAYGTMMAFSLPLILSSWAGLFGTNWFDYMVIRKYLPLSDVGLYSLGCLMAGVVQQVTIIFSTLLVPQFSVMVAKGEHEKIAAFVERVLPYWFLGTSVLLTFVLFGAGPVIPLVFGEEFTGSVPVLALLVLATCGLALFNAFSPLVIALGSTWVLSGICLISGGINVLMDFVLIPTYGIQGAAFATVLAYAASAFMVLAFVQTRVHARVLGLSLLALPVAVVCLCFFVVQGLLFYALAIPAGAVCVYWLVGRFRLFRAEDAVFLQGLRLPAALFGRVP